ncbi:MAG TPA: HIT domain-containing protein [Candidatus Nanoarchaeia archaeon]|nr:HIT domain-containing protein [Candidatus Nanoarchaeia archaeon]
MNPDCLFCKIANGDPEKLVWENEYVAAFNDIHPKAPVHVLVTPKQHINSFDELDDPMQTTQLFQAVRQVAHFLNLKGRWRVIINVGRSAGQVIDHLHVHILGGKDFTHAEVDNSAK